jgi:hypothetical protein
MDLLMSGSHRKALLSIGITFCLFSSVFAYSGGSGTTDEPYLIATAADLNSLGGTPGDWGKCFKLVADVNMSAYAGTEYKIIGNDTTKFTGVFDGNGHVIRNLTYTATSPVGYAGMFGKALNATIKNLGVEDVNFSTLSCWSGGLVGYSSYCTISNCYSTGKVAPLLSSGSSSYSAGYSAGGLVGWQDYGSIINCHSTVSVTSSVTAGGLVGYQNYGSITNCYNTGAVVSSSAIIGGLVGYQKYGNITNCYSTGAVTGYSPYPDSKIGGLVGYDYYGNITSCYAAGEVNGISKVGGLVGYIIGDYYNTTIKNCYATGAVSGSSDVGGLVGYNGSRVSNCYAAGAVSGTSHVGGLMGYNSSYLINCFWDTEASGQSSGVGYGSSTGVTGKMTADMKKLSTFANAGWNIADINGAETDWVMLPDGQDYPKINFLFCHDCFAAIPLLGSGTEQDPYQIQSAADFVALGNYCSAWDKYIVLTADIDLTGFVIRPIGNSVERFTGNFNGQGFVIRNAVMNMPNKNYVGLFGRVGNGGVIADLGVEDVNIVGKKFVGGLVGFNSGTISNCYSTGFVALNSSSFAGGLIGFSSSGTISDCCSTVNISGSAAAIGGLVGCNGKRNMISNCCASGTIADTNSNRFDSCAGGLVGSNCGTIYDSYATGDIAAIFNSSSAYFYLGGIAGDNSGGTISGSYATGNISVTSNPSTVAICVGGLVGLNKSGNVNDCYSTGQITFNCSSESSYMVGGVVGLNCGNSINRCYSICAIGLGASAAADCSVGGLAGFSMNGVVSESFWDIQTSGKTISGGGKGLTTEQMKTMLIYQNAGWGDNGWVMNDGLDYPRLDWEGTEGVSIPVSVTVPFLGSGTAENPYQIWTAAEFAYLSWYNSVLDKHIVLMADIDLAGIRVCPIGEFTGIFDGNGHVACNIEIYEPTNCYVGVFSRLGTGGVIINFGIKDANIVGGNCVGGLVGKNEGGAVSGCYSTGTINGLSDTGGLIGRSDSGTVDNCYSTAAVTVWPYNNSVSYGGGLVGYVDSGTISKCYSTGFVSPSASTYTGGLIGRGTSTTATQSFWDKTTSGKATSAGGTGAVGKTTAQMKTLSTFTSAGWDFVGETANGTLDIWAMGSGQYPCLVGKVNIIVPNLVSMTPADAENAIVAAGLRVGTITSSYSSTVTKGNIASQSPAAGMVVSRGTLVNIVISLGWCYSGGAGTETNPYQIADTNDLLALAVAPAEDYNKCFILTADINMAGRTISKSLIAGTFTGIFDGKGHKIVNLNISNVSHSNLALIGTLGNSGLITNLILENFSITGSTYIGGMVGYNSGSISNCSFEGTVSGNRYTGGLVGYNNGIITSCYFNGNVGGRTNAEYTGGLVGVNNGNISNCYSKGTVSTGQYGRMVGGLAGVNSIAEINNCYSACSIISVFGQWAIGGFTGGNAGAINSSFWDVNASGLTTSAGGTGKTTAEMKTRSTFTNAGWDFVGETTNGTEDIWFIRQGIDYPKFVWQDQTPTANSGPDQTVYAWIDGVADVNLDGSDSNDPDGDAISYKWTWIIDSNTYEANGVNPIIELPVGIHTIQLVVNDGIVDSAPDDVNITVIAPLKGKLEIIPCIINRSSYCHHRRPEKILAFIRLPEGVTKNDIDNNEPITLYPGEIEASKQRIVSIPCGHGRHKKWFAGVLAFFDKDDVLDAIPTNGQVELKVAGKLKSGQYFYGSDTVKIIGPRWPWHWPKL